MRRFKKRKEQKKKKEKKKTTGIKQWTVSVD